MGNHQRVSKAQSVMYSSFQKFYSALNNINHFRLENNSFENASYLDNFFSEFRNITFVLQKSLPKGSDNLVYQEFRTKYFSNPEMKWFITKRNQVIHENPVNLIRFFQIQVYGISSIITRETIFYDDEDHPLEDIQKAIQVLLDSLEEKIEINFSVRHLIMDENNHEYLDMISLIREGVGTMWLFLDSLRNALDDNSPPLLRLEKEIKTLLMQILSNEILFVTDYVYHVTDKKLIPASVGNASFGLNIENPKLTRIQEEYNFMAIDFDNDLDLFKWFVSINLPLYVAGHKDLMSTFFIVYNDKSFTIRSFFSSQRATTYRMINDVANMVKEGKIRAVMFMWESIGYDMALLDKISKMTHDERGKLATIETVEIALISKRTCRLIQFDPNRVKEEGYFEYILGSIKSEISGPFLAPIKKAFEDLL